MRKIITTWIFGCFIITLFAGLIYAAVQQDLRQSANDPQIQMVEDAAAVLKNGGVPADVVPRVPLVDIQSSLTPFIMVFDKNGLPLESSARLGASTVPVPPAGIFDTVRASGQYRFTWQPAPALRFAVVMSYADGAHPYYVMAGRSLREVEVREDKLSFMVLVSWVTAMIATTLFLALYRFL